jgi:hypothetical protein
MALSVWHEYSADKVYLATQVNRSNGDLATTVRSLEVIFYNLLLCDIFNHL